MEQKLNYLQININIFGEMGPTLKAFNFNSRHRNSLKFFLGVRKWFKYIQKNF